MPLCLCRIKVLPTVTLAKVSNGSTVYFFGKHITLQSISNYLTSDPSLMTLNQQHAASHSRVSVEMCPYFLVLQLQITSLSVLQQHTLTLNHTEYAITVLHPPSGAPCYLHSHSKPSFFAATANDCIWQLVIICHQETDVRARGLRQDNCRCYALCVCMSRNNTPEWI